jgi:hypothetical protein
MRTRMFAVLAMMAMMFLVPSVAQADPPGNGPPELCDIMPWLPQCDGGSGDSISIDTPTEQECPTGGIVVVFNEVRYPICNGSNGSTGETGATGADGQSIMGATGNTGADGQSVTGATGANGSNGASAPTCAASTRAHTRLRLPSRFDGLRKVRVVVDGVSTRTKVVNGTVKVNILGQPCGWHVVQVKKPGLRGALRLWKVTGARGLKRVTVGGTGWRSGLGNKVGTVTGGSEGLGDTVVVTP